MRRTIKLLTLTAMMAVFAAPAFAQAKECNEENKGAWYQTFLANFRGEPPQQKIAYEAAKAYLDSCPADPNDQQATYMRDKFVVPYEKIHKDADIAKQCQDAINKKNYADEIKFCKQVLATDPDNPAVNIMIGIAGLSDTALLNDSAPYAKRSIELIEAGKTFAPYETKDKALAALTYEIAKATVRSDPTASIPLFLKAAKYESDLKKQPQLYAELADAYGSGPVAKLTSDYQAFVGKDETTESKLVLANLNQAIDRQIDAFARAAALSTTADDKKAIMVGLTELYKYRMKTDAGLDTLVAGILSKPLPDMPTPITSLPSTPATNGASPTGTNGTSQPGTTGGGSKPAGTTSGGPTGSTVGTQTGKTGPGAKPAASPTPKPPRRENHRHG